MKAYCLFEQSRTFKNAFKRFGVDAYDFDILNDFGETDYVMDLFAEINNAYGGGKSVFDKITQDDLIFAFFPCTRFENQIILHFTGNVWQMKNYTLEKKLECDLKLHEELHELYMLITKLALVCIRKGLKLIIENPYSQQHYLTRYWACAPSIIDKDRSRRGDYYKKPTQYFFINCEPKCDIVFDYMEEIPTQKTIGHTSDKVERSMISPIYAERFIKEFIL